MKRIIFIISLVSVLSICLVGCMKETVQVETRTYDGDESGLDYSGWTKETCTVEQGAEILNNSKYHISAKIDKVNANSLSIKFSDEVVLPDKNTSATTFTVQRGRTYLFVAGGGLSGLEIKIRY